MNTLEDSTNEEANDIKMDFTGKEEILAEQFEIIRAFFLTDSASEMIESLNALIETYLFSEDMNVTSGMRIHIVNQLRVVTLLAKLEKTFQKSLSKPRKPSSPS